MKWRNFSETHADSYGFKPQEVLEAVALFPERCVFLLFLPESLFLSAKTTRLSKETERASPTGNNKKKKKEKRKSEEKTNREQRDQDARHIQEKGVMSESRES